jgi:hypothetical protein
LKKSLVQDSKSHAMVSDLAGCVVAAEKAKQWRSAYWTITAPYRISRLISLRFVI